MRLTLLCPVGGDARCRLRQHSAGGDRLQLKLNDLDARITRIERIVANQVEAAQHLDEVQGNVRQLRGRLEELEHSNEALAKQQRDLYAIGQAPWRPRRAGRQPAQRRLAGRGRRRLR